MNKAVKILIIYLLLLLLCSLIFSWLNVKTSFINFTGNSGDTELNIMMIPTIIGGIIALALTVPFRSLKIFLIIYFSLWGLRFLLLFMGYKIGEVHLFNRTFHFDLIIANYYKTVSRLATPVPFILYWFINFIFTKKLIPEQKNQQDQLL